MIRYRSLRIAPGAKRPWLIESDDESQPLDGGRCTSAGVRTVIPPGASTVTCPAPVIVMSACAGRPHEGQNLALSDTSPPHSGQRTRRFYLFTEITDLDGDALASYK
jgi:hypothetical protein